MRTQYFWIYVISAFGPLTLLGQIRPVYQPYGNYESHPQLYEAYGKSYGLKTRETVEEKINWEEECEKLGYSELFIFEGSSRKIPINRILKHGDGVWKGLMNDERVKWNYRWGFYGTIPVHSLLLAVDSENNVYIPLRLVSGQRDGYWDYVGQIGLKNWFVRHVLPMGKHLEDPVSHLLLHFVFGI